MNVHKITERNVKRAIQVLKAYPHLKLFPAIWDRRHVPQVAHWSNSATSDPRTIARWGAFFADNARIDVNKAKEKPYYRQNFRDRFMARKKSECVYFCVAADLSGVVIIDVDNKPDSTAKLTGEQALDQLEEAGYILDRTLTSITPSGNGQHYIYNLNGAKPIKHNVRAFGEDAPIDLPVMVPLPGQVAGKKGEYILQKNARGRGGKYVPAKIAPVPEWIRTTAGVKRDTHPDARKVLIDLDTDENIERATRYLENDAPIPEYGERDNTVFKVAARLRDMGISDDRSYELMYDHWIPNCDSLADFPDSQIVRKIKSAWDNAQNPAGCDTVEYRTMDFGTYAEDIEKEQRLETKALIFPDMTSGNNPAPMTTIDNVKVILRGYGINVRYNEMRHEHDWSHPYYGSHDNIGDATIEYAKDWCRRHYFKYVGDVQSILTTISDQRSFHPVINWLEGEDGGKWDGVSRLQQLYDTIVTASRVEPWFKEALIRRWLTSAIAALYEPRFSCRGVLVLQGDENLGKTSWFKALCPEDMFKGGMVLDPYNKDSVIQNNSAWLVELGEVDSTLKKDLSALKAYITNDKDTLRRAFGRTQETIRRRTVYGASVNDLEFLKDESGNTRFWCLECVDIHYRHAIDMRQVWLEVKETLYEKGESWFLDRKESKMLTHNNEKHKLIDEVEETILRLYDASAPGTRTLSATEVLREAGISNPNRTQAARAGKALRKHFETVNHSGVTRYRVPESQLTRDFDDLVSDPATDFPTYQ